MSKAGFVGLRISGDRVCGLGFRVLGLSGPFFLRKEAHTPRFKF